MIDAQQLGLSQHELQIVSDILSTHVPERPVYAFGSRAVGRARRLSDIDLAIGGEAPLTLRQRALLKEDFLESNLPMFVDVLDLHTVTPEFRARIEKDFVVVQGPSEIRQVAA